MSVDTLIFWVFVAAWLVVLALIAMQLVQAFVEGRRGIGHAMRLAKESPIPFHLAKAQGDSLRISAAIDRVGPLGARAVAAIEVITSTPRVPPVIGTALRRIRSEVNDFKSAR